MFQRLVAVEFGAVVPSDGFERKAAGADQLQRGSIHCGCRARGELGHQSYTGTSLDKGEQAVALIRCTDHGVTLPVPRLRAPLNDLGPGVDHRLALQTTTLLGSEGAFAPTFATLPQEAP